MDQFETEVRSAFNIIKDIGLHFSKIDRQDYGFWITFSSSKVFVCVSFGAPEWRVELSFGRVGSDENYPLGPGDLLHIYPLPSVSAKFGNDLQEEVAYWARYVVGLPEQLLTGDNDFYSQLWSNRSHVVTRGVLSERQYEARRAWEKAQDAFRNGDFNGFIARLTPHENDLTNAQIAKLEYARRRRS